MSKVRTTTTMRAGLFGLLLAICLAQSAIGGTEISAGDRAKMAKERAKQSAAFGNNGGDSAEGGQGQDSGCNLDIGNVSTAGRGRTPREVNVFITGDVIQANRNCR